MEIKRARVGRVLNKNRLIDLECGKAATVAELQNASYMKKRLMSIGIVEGTRIRPIYEGTAGSLRAYEFRGSVFAIRDEDARHIIVE